VFITPEVAGWVFAVAATFPDAGSPEFLPWLEGLSRRLGEVQYFGTHRMVEYHAWARAEQGRIVRAYGWSGERGETLVDVGPRSPEEIELGLGVSLVSENEDQDLAWPHEEAVLAVAGRWSLNPVLLEEIDAEPGLGVSGDLRLQYSDPSPG
jgi:hypothetical protein